MAEVDRLITAAAGAIELTTDELRQILDHIAHAGFDPNARERVRGRLAGLVWQGQALRGTDQLSPAEVHYLWHVVTRQEWPDGTSLPDYSETIRQVILDSRSGVFTSRYQGMLQLGIVRPSEALRGPRGFEWLLVEYRTATGHWVTAYQLPSLVLDLQNARRSEIRWLRYPQQPIK